MSRPGSRSDPRQHPDYTYVIIHVIELKPAATARHNYGVTGGRKNILDRDLNGDGVADLVALDAGSLTNNLFIFLGEGKGRFVAKAPLSVPAGALAAAVGDWDGDGHLDLVTLSNMNDSLCVLRNTSP